MTSSGQENHTFQHQQIQKYIPHRNREHSGIHIFEHVHKTECRYVHYYRPTKLHRQYKHRTFK